MPLSLFESLGLAANGQKFVQGSVSGISGTKVELEVYRFDDMLVRNVHIPAPILFVYSPMDYADAKERARAHALARLGLTPDAPMDDRGNPFFVLGRDFISNHRLFISHSTDMLYIRVSHAGS